ncbi:MAG: amidohydrolase family protein [Phycisphaerales bacterium]|nr:amidohydrolase family protein [Phycisphaerales bacterium]
MLPGPDDTFAPTDAPVVVLIENGRITGLLPTADYTFQPGDELFRAEGRWLIPGLIDVAAGDATATERRLMPLFGVTTAALSSSGCVECARGTIASPGLGATPVLPIGSGGAAGGAARQEWIVPMLAAQAAAHRAPAAMDLVDVARVSAWGPPRDGDPTVPPAPARWPADRTLVGSGLGRVGVPAGRGVVEEIDALVAAGVPVADALLGATARAATALGIRDRVGAIEPGRVADLVLLDANPLDDPSALGRPVAVVHDGRMLYRVELEVVRARIEEAARLFRHAFEDADPLPPWVADQHDTWIWTLDGLPFSAHRAAARREADGGVRTEVRREIWTPLWSKTSVSASHAADGTLVSATVRHHAPVLPFVADIRREGPDLVVELEVEDGPRERHRVSGAGGELLLLDTLPLPRDLERVLAATEKAGSVLEGRELVYGEGAIELAPIRLAARGSAGPLGACLNGEAALVKRALEAGDGRSWRLAIGPAGRLERAWIETEVGTIEVRRVTSRGPAAPGNGGGSFKSD